MDLTRGLHGAGVTSHLGEASADTFLWPKPVMVYSNEENNTVPMVFGIVGKDFKARLCLASIL